LTISFSRIAEKLEESLPHLETIVMTSNNMQELVCCLTVQHESIFHVCWVE